MRRELRKERPKRKWFPLTIEMTIWFGMTAAVGIAFYNLVAFAQSARCPTNSYAAGSSGTASLFVVLPILFASVVPGLLLSNALTGITARTRKFFDGDPDYRKNVSFRYSWRFNREFSVASVYVAPVLLPFLISLTSSFSQFCLAPDRIVDRVYPWSSARNYGWDDVRKITTMCQYDGKNSWSSNFILEFYDGRTLDVMNGTGPVWKHEADLQRSLAGKHFDFDSSKVDPNCGVANPQMLLNKP